MRAHRVHRFVNLRVRAPHLIELRDDRFVGLLRRTRGFAACGESAARDLRRRELVSGGRGLRRVARGGGAVDDFPIVVGALSERSADADGQQHHERTASNQKYENLPLSHDPPWTEARTESPCLPYTYNLSVIAPREADDTSRAYFSITPLL